MEIRFEVTIPNKDKVENLAKIGLKKNIEERFNKKLHNVRCPEHNQRPKFTVHGTLENPQIKIGGCCQDLIDKATRSFSKLAMKFKNTRSKLNNNDPRCMW